MKLCNIHTVTVWLGNSLCGWQQEHATLVPYYALYLRHSLHLTSFGLIGVNNLYPLNGRSASCLLNTQNHGSVIRSTASERKCQLLGVAATFRRSSRSRVRQGSLA